MKHIVDFLVKTLTSRKFWAAVAASLPLALTSAWPEFATVWMVYAGVQGGVDAVAALRPTTDVSPRATIVVPMSIPDSGPVGN